MTYAVDLSNWTTPDRVDDSIAAGGKLTDALVQDWVAHGFTHAIIGTQWPHVCQHQLEVCHRNGMTLDLYSWLTWSRPSGQALYTMAMQRLAEGFPVGRHWLDVEETPSGIPHEAVVQQIRDGISGLGGFPTGIYTGRYVFPELCGPTTEFSNLPLWLADYRSYVPTDADFTPFNGWTRASIWQYAGSVQEMGANLDLNVVLDQAVLILQEANPLSNLNADGSQRIVSEGTFITTYNNNIPVQRLGSTDGQFPGRMSKLFGNTWLWFRTLDDSGNLIAPYWSQTEGD